MEQMSGSISALALPSLHPAAAPPSPNHTNKTTLARQDNYISSQHSRSGHIAQPQQCACLTSSRFHHQRRHGHLSNWRQSDVFEALHHLGFRLLRLLHLPLQPLGGLEQERCVMTMVTTTPPDSLSSHVESCCGQ